MKHQKASPITYVFPMVLFTLLLCCILVLVVLGSNVYQTLTEQQQQNNSSRIVLRYLSSAVHSADRENAVQIRPGPQGDALILIDHAAGYETRIYVMDQVLMEEVSTLGSDFSPQNAQSVGSCTEFEPWFSTPQLLCIKTNEGTVKTALHTLQGGSQ